MPTETMRRSRTLGHTLPLIHFYQEFVKTASGRSSTKSNSDGLSPTIELSLTKPSARLRSLAMSSDAIIKDNKVGKSPNTESTTTTTRHESLSAWSGPVSPLTPIKSSTSRHGVGTASRIAASNDTKKTEIIAPTNKKLTIYERSQLRLKEREKKIQSIRDEIMKDCTFRPNTGRTTAPKTSDARKKGPSARRSPQRSTDKSSTTTPTTATTPTRTTSSTRQYWQEYQRNHQQQLQASAASSRDGSKTSHTTKSMRFEELYEDGLRKARQRPATEKAEQEQRKNRWEEQQLKDCTFKPKLYWGTRVVTKRRKPLVPGTQVPAFSPRTNSTREQTGARSRSPQRSLSPIRRQLFDTPRQTKKGEAAPMYSQTDPFPHIELSPIPLDMDGMDSSCASLSLLRRHHDMIRQRSGKRDADTRSPIPPLPLEITTTGVASLPFEIITTGVAPMSPVGIRSRPWSTVQYSSTREEPFRSHTRRTLGIEIDEYQEKTPSAPRIIFSSATFGGDSVAVFGGDSVAAQTERTDYGSI